jgi:xanthine dehydrogenase accessory factor
MTSSTQDLKTFIQAQAPVALVEVTEAKGSTPRESGTRMLVSPERIHGTIGGGQLEFMAIHRARDLLRDGEAHAGLDIPLGPEIGQCCGGRVGLSIRLVDAALQADLVAQAAQEDQARPHVFLFGGGHVGTALAAAFSLLPVQVVVVETRADALEGMPASVDKKLTPVPEEVVRDARPGSAFVVLTHDHALDFLIVGEALKRGDAAYVGMIGSKTKKATCRNWYLKTAGGTEAEFAHLVTPIGGDVVKDKRPAVIAALAAAEIMTALSAGTAAAA